MELALETGKLKIVVALASLLWTTLTTLYLCILKVA
jgi:hypothetical protein